MRTGTGPTSPPSRSSRPGLTDPSPDEFREPRSERHHRVIQKAAQRSCSCLRLLHESHAGRQLFFPSLLKRRASFASPAWNCSRTTWGPAPARRASGSPTCLRRPKMLALAAHSSGERPGHGVRACCPARAARLGRRPVLCRVQAPDTGCHQSDLRGSRTWCGPCRKRPVSRGTVNHAAAHPPQQRPR
jgi:hypothetical protein